MSRPLGSSTLEAGAVRTYHGRTIEDLIGKIKDDLGPDAIIVHRREGLTGGVAGFFQRLYVEIDAIPGGPRIAAYDEEPVAVRPRTLPPTSSPQAPPQYQRPPQQPALPGWSSQAPTPQAPISRAPTSPGQPASLGPSGALPEPARTPFYEREPLHGGTGGGAM